MTSLGRFDAACLARRVLRESRHIGRQPNPVLLSTRPAMKHGDKTFGVVEGPCL